MTTPPSDAAARAQAFRALHAAPFVIPNPWDAGSARLLESLGFRALATTSAGFAFSRGRPDNGVTRDEVLAHLRELVAATSLPVSADLENGFGRTAREVAETFRLAAATGIAGGSIEDSTNDGAGPQFPLGEAAERVRAAAEAARSLGLPFTLTARAENFIVGRADLKDTIERLQAYQEAGADVLYAPGLATREDITTVLRAIDRPLNVLAGVPGLTLTIPELFALGVRRVSVGGSLARAAFGALLRAARELQDTGTTGYADYAMPGRDLNRLLGAG